MTTLLWCSLAALVGAVIVLGIVARVAIREMHEAMQHRDHLRVVASDAERDQHIAESEARRWKIMHDRLLAKHNRKRAKVLVFSAAPTPTTGAS